MNARKLRDRVVAGSLALTGLLLTGVLADRCAADNYQVDPTHSFVSFRVKHMGVGYAYGRFDDLAGSFMFEEGNPVGVTFDFTIKADSVDSNNSKRDQHLKGPDFFNVKEYPTITFKSGLVRRSGERGFEVAGDLTLHGVTRPINAKLEWVGSGKDQLGGFRQGFEGTFVLKRSDFGMNFGLDGGGLGDEVRVTVAFEGVKK
jgi:polyisoprenoid-binding protein YceI